MVRQWKRENFVTLGDGNLIYPGTKIHWLSRTLVNMTLCEGVVFSLLECFMGIDIMYDWETLPLPYTMKLKPV